MTTTMQTADGAGRVALGPRFAGRLVIVREVDATEAVVTAARAVPERDARRAPGGRAAPQGRPMGKLGDAVAYALRAEGRPMGWTELAKAIIAAGWPGGDPLPCLARAIQRVAAGDRRLRAEGRMCALSGSAGGPTPQRRRREWSLLSDAVSAALGSAGRPMGVAEIAKAIVAGGLWPDEGGRRLERAVWHAVAWELRPGGGGRFRRVPPGASGSRASVCAAGAVGIPE